MKLCYMLEFDNNFVKKQIANATYGLFVPNSINKKNIIYKGGAQWMGANVDNRNSTICSDFVNKRI